MPTPRALGFPSSAGLALRVRVFVEVGEESVAFVGETHHLGDNCPQ
jgi:hypothetical protein